MELRPYQQEAINAVYHHLRDRDDNPCVVCPTGSGKSLIMSTLCHDAVAKWGGRVLILAHVKELLQQTAGTLRRISPDLDIGVYSAGLRRRDTDHPVIVAGIQSVYQRACELDRFDLIIVDEAHLLPPDGEGMYRTFLADAKVVNPNVRLIGLTATPYRMKSGMLCGPDNLLNAICYEVGVKELITQGFLCPLRSKAGRRKVDTSSLHIRAGEFVGSEVEELMDTDELVLAACREIVEMTADRKAVLIFAASVKHAEHVKDTIERLTGNECGLVTGNTPTSERDYFIARFKGEQIPANLFGDAHPPLKYLVNVNVLTTGFDAPNVDCVVLLRPTASPGLYYQMTGRGFRVHPDKEDTLVLDYGGNILRHGPVDAIQIAERTTSGSGNPPAKECPECRSVVHAAYSVCPDCGYEFPPPENGKHDARASDEGILTGQVVDTEYDVTDVFYSVHTKRGADEDAPKTMRVTYQVGLNDYQSEWVCPEHDGWARQKFEQWWLRRSNDPVPNAAERAVDIAEAGGVATTRRITVRKVTGEKFDRIIDCELGEKPEPVPAHVAMGHSEDDIPF
ncbi:MAG: DEAD/DEAH box helicase family protein [Candidatus Nealsonbacteria bacterium]|nr:DEAD/DEAH box helicase family protein [Candidatus Nealsonbacteria bacterium]